MSRIFYILACLIVVKLSVDEHSDNEMHFSCPDLSAVADVKSGFMYRCFKLTIVFLHHEMLNICLCIAMFQCEDE